MANDKGYNGWTNYETWNVKLWMDNDEGSYRFWREMAQEAWGDSSAGDAWHGSTHAESAVADLAKRLESFYEENTPTVTGCYADLLNAALSEVNWHEIAGAVIEDEDLKDDDDVSADSDQVAP